MTKKKKDSDLVICGTCFSRFEGKDAAARLKAHYEAIHPINHIDEKREAVK